MYSDRDLRVSVFSIKSLFLYVCMYSVFGEEGGGGDGGAYYEITTNCDSGWCWCAYRPVKTEMNCGWSVLATGVYAKNSEASRLWN